MTRLTQLAPVLVAMLLAGCAAQQAQVPTDTDWQQHSTRVQALETWTARGKLALRSPDQAESASIVWQQQGARTHLHLSGPMGLKATTIVSDGRQLELRQGDEISTWDTSDLEGVALKTGWELPLQALPHWLKGVPWPDSEIQLLELDAGHTLLRTLQQDHWEVQYEHYGTFGGFTLPTRLSIRREDTSARVIIRLWKIPPG